MPPPPVNRTQTASPSTDKATTTTDTPADPSAELTTAVDDLLEQLRNKFAAVSSDMFTKMDEMSRRLDVLETQLRDDATAKDEPSTAGGTGSSSGR